MNINITRLLFIVTLSVILWSIIINLSIGESVTWQIISFAWCTIAMGHAYELYQLKKKLNK